MYRKLAAFAVSCAVVAPAFAIDYDEDIDGDLADSEATPTVLGLTVGSNIVSGTIGGGAATSPPDDFYDAFTISIGAGETLEAVNLLVYNTAGGNTSSGFNVATGTSWNGDFLASNFIDSALLTTASIGTDLLDQVSFGGSLGEGDYVIGIREGTPGQVYSLEFVVVPAPASLALLGLGAFAGTRRRR